MLFPHKKHFHQKYEAHWQSCTKLSLEQSSTMPHRITPLTANKRKQGQKCNSTTISYKPVSVQFKKDPPSGKKEEHCNISAYSETKRTIQEYAKILQTPFDLYTVRHSLTGQREAGEVDKRASLLSQRSKARAFNYRKSSCTCSKSAHLSSRHSRG